MKTSKILLLSLTICFFGCTTKESISDKQPDQNEHLVLSTLWMETSAEVKALQLQAYNIAQFRIEQYAKNNNLIGNEAVVLDIDETVLQTTSYQIEMIMHQFAYPTGWLDFINKADCKPIPGSLNFLKYADSVGIKIFYVSNRTEDQRVSVTENLKKFGFPQLSSSNILLKTKASGKDERRNLIKEKQNILLLIGDNLGDFSDILNLGDYEKRMNSVFQESRYFGDKFIILPNSTYGDWESSLHPEYWKVSASKRDSIRKEILRSLEHN